MPQWNRARERAQRQLVEFNGVSLEQLADATGRSLNSIRKQAQLHGWRLSGEDDRTVAKLRKASASIARRVEEMLRISEHGDALDKSEMDALNSAVRVTEKLIEILSPDELIRDNALRQNEDLAQMLDRINRRIVSLAKELAADMAAGKSGGNGERNRK
ncbi:MULTISPECIES: hypothetical protein [Mesorhizobium]|uniref:hypothetical protein n=1 Tax=Mesorhizobium TaxID=68287 RepID=UPI0010C121EC|nr:MULTISPECIES: hypothetical protein [Mesorhizobium]